MASPLTDSPTFNQDIKNVIPAFEQPTNYQYLWRYRIKHAKVAAATDGHYHVLGFALADDESFVTFKQSPYVTIDAE